MHISTYVKIETVDESILSRISEADVANWMAAKHNEIRQGIPQASGIELESNFRKYRDEQYFDVSWSMHALDKCALNHNSIASACREIRQELLNNPRQRAAEARAKANALLKEAEELESVSL